MITVGTTRFKTLNLCILPTQCIYVLRTELLYIIYKKFSTKVKFFLRLTN
jgi:hypothetical protein